MNARALNMLHDTGDKDILAVTDGVNLDFGALEIFIDKDRIFNVLSEDDSHVFLDVSLVKRDDHVLAAENVGRTEQNRIADFVGYAESFLGCHYGYAARTLDMVLFKKLVKTLSVLSHVDCVVGGSQNVDSAFAEEFCKLDSCLTAERHYHAEGILGFDDSHNVLGGEGFKVKSVGGVKVG